MGDGTGELCHFCKKGKLHPTGGKGVLKLRIKPKNGESSREFIEYECDSCHKKTRAPGFTSTEAISTSDIDVRSDSKLYDETIVYSGKVSEMAIKGNFALYLDMPRKPEEAQMSFPLQGAFGILTVEEIFKPYLGKDISITIEKSEGKIHNITIQEEFV